jgi:hypothetical protein
LHGHLDRFQILRVLDHHIDKIFGVPKCFQNRFGFRVPVVVGRRGKLMLDTGLDNPGVLEMGRIGFTADLFDQLKRRINRVLKIKNFIRTVVKMVDSILLGLF